MCVGESVVIECYLFPSFAGEYSGFFAGLSFNGSEPEDFNDINTMFGSIGYVADVDLPVMSDSARIRLTITSFQVSDSNTVFGCHAQLNLGGTFTPGIGNTSASLAGWLQ